MKHKGPIPEGLPQGFEEIIGRDSQGWREFKRGKVWVNLGPDGTWSSADGAGWTDGLFATAQLALEATGRKR